MRLVWIVDDDEEMAHALELMLELLECKTAVFLDARSAARTLQFGIYPDIIILDINMPEVSGIDLLEFLRRREDMAGIPVIMLSTETADVQVDEALDKGANAFVFKPVSIEELEAALQQVYSVLESQS